MFACQVLNGPTASAWPPRYTTRDPLQVEPVLQDLVALGWCGRLDEAGDQRHVLLIDPPRTLALPLVNRLLLHEQHSTAAFRHRAGLGTMTVAELLD